MNRILSVLAVLLFSAMICVPAAAQIVVDSSVNFKVTNVNSGLVLGIAGGSVAANANAVQTTDTGSTGNLWHFVPVQTSNEYWIVNVNSGQVLGIANGSKSEGQLALQWADNGTADHLWQVISTGINNASGSPEYKIKNVNSGYVLGISGASTAVGADALQWADNGTLDHLWTFTAEGAAYPAPQYLTGNVVPGADPSMIKDQNGEYHFYATGGGIQQRDSADRYDWPYYPGALYGLVYDFNPAPSWTNAYTDGTDLWAPDVSYHNGQYYMYYAASTFGKTKSAIGLATSPTAQLGSWTDSGSAVLTSSTCSGSNAIDPGLLVDANGNWWLSFGSYSDGINMVQLNPSTGRLLSNTPTCYHLALPLVGTAIEGAYIYPHGGYYYLFAARYSCCDGSTSNYHIIMGRSTSPTGPYYDRGGLNMASGTGGGTIFLATHGNIIGPGGPGLFRDTDGDVLVYFYYDGNNNGYPTLGINPVAWTSDGWPYVTEDAPPAVTVGVTNSPARFMQADSADTLTIGVTNTSSTTTADPTLTLTASLPSGMTATAIAGSNASTGWNCNVASLTCTRSNGLLAGASDPVTLTVAVAANASIGVGAATVSATASGGGIASTATGTDAITIGGTPIITWPTPAPITYGTPLSASQLDASSNVAGTFAYNQQAGAILSAGMQTLSVTFTPSNPAVYATVTSSVSLQVNTSAPTITWNAPTAITYGTPLSGAQLNATANVPGSFAYSPLSGATLPAGMQTLSVTFTPTDSTDYTTVMQSTTLQVNPAAATVTPAASSKVYGTPDSALTGMLAGFLPADGVTASYSRTPGEAAGGAYVISATLNPVGVLSNYSITYNTAPFTISPASALVSLGNVTQTYSGLPEPVSVSTMPTVAGLNISYAGTGSTTYGPTATAPANPGTYSVSVTVVDPNYIGTANGVLTINQADPTVTLGLLAGSPSTTPYGTTVYFSFNTATAPQCPTGTAQLYVDSVATGAPVALTSTSCAQPIQFQTAALTAGPHSIYASYSGDAYFIAESSTPVAYSVTQDATTVTLATSSGTVNVGQPVTYTATVNPVAADNAAPPSGTVAFFDGANQIGTGPLSTTAPYVASFTTSSLAAGPHSITASFTDTDGNFTASSSAIETETVNLNVPTINWTPAATTIPYGTALDGTELNATAVDGNGNPIAGTFSYNFTLNTVPGVGTANVTASFTPDDPTTYASNSATISFTVNPVQLTVTADSFGRNYGAGNPAFTYQIAGFANGESSAVVSGQPTCSTMATTTSAPAAYAITCTANTLSSPNYTFTFVDGTLTVSPAPLMVTVNPATITYGSSLPVLSGNVSGLTAGDTLGGSIVVVYSSSTPASSAAGSYPTALTATVSGSSSGNYSIVVTPAALTINKASSSVTFSASPNPAIAGTTETLTAAVSGAGQPGGSVLFTVGATTLCSAPVNGSGVASCTFVPSASGSLSIQAAYQGDVNHLSSMTSLLLNVYDGAVQLHLASTQLVYPGATNVTACVTGATPSTATGTIAIEDGTTVLTSQSLQGGGCAYWYISPGLAAGTHTLSAVYSGDRNNPSGTSIPVVATVSPAAANLLTSCWNASSPYGGNYQCTIGVSSNGGTPQGFITYSVDGASPVTVPISGGNAQLTLARPSAGNHKVVIGYAQQGNYAAATSQTETFTVTPAPTQIQLSPSSYYQPASATLTLTASLTSWSAGAPQGGTVAFYAGSTLLGSVPAGGECELARQRVGRGNVQVLRGLHSGWIGRLGCGGVVRSFGTAALERARITIQGGWRGVRRQPRARSGAALLQGRFADGLARGHDGLAFGERAIAKLVFELLERLLREVVLFGLAHVNVVHVERVDGDADAARCLVALFVDDAFEPVERVAGAAEGRDHARRHLGHLGHGALHLEVTDAGLEALDLGPRDGEGDIACAGQLLVGGFGLLQLRTIFGKLAFDRLQTKGVLAGRGAVAELHVGGCFRAQVGLVVFELADLADQPLDHAGVRGQADVELAHLAAEVFLLHL